MLSKQVHYNGYTRVGKVGANLGHFRLFMRVLLIMCKNECEFFSVVILIFAMLCSVPDLVKSNLNCGLNLIITTPTHPTLTHPGL